MEEFNLLYCTDCFCTLCVKARFVYFHCIQIHSCIDCYLLHQVNYFSLYEQQQRYNK
jgi:hypothetical protein